MESIGAWFSGWLLSPWLLGLGALLIAAPILIHLLNRRKFITVDWAAMDFLVEAERRNRRRVRLENLLLLLLRCLAMLLIGLMLARPFSCQFAPRLFEAQRFERIVLFDDSLSMQVVSGNQTTLDKAKNELKDLVRSLADNGADDSLTLLLASRPTERLLSAAPVQSSGDDLIRLLKTIEEIEPSDRTAQLEAGLLEIEDLVRGEANNINRVAYIVSDMRRRDWRLDDSQADTPTQLLRRLADTVGACFVIDVGSPTDAVANVVVTAITPENALIGGVSTQFQVTVANPSDTEARDVAIELAVGDALPLVRVIDRIAPGESATEPFFFKLPNLSADDAAPLRVRAAALAGSPEQDRLAADSERYYAGSVVRGVPTLLVDGAPSSIPSRAESYYLKRALEPPGELLSGVSTTTVSDAQFENLSLEPYRVIFLCNVYRLTEQRVATLKTWVKNGGGLVILPGDQVDQREFNALFAANDEPLSPLRLVQLSGDETEAVWSQFRVADSQHPALRVFDGQDNPFLDNVKIFRWWKTETTDAATESSVAITLDENERTGGEASPSRVLAWIGNEEQAAPGIAEKRWGRGRVTVLAIPADADWSNWASDPSFLIAMQELTQHLSTNTGSQRELLVGETIRQAVDLTQAERSAVLTLPGGGSTNVQAQEATPAENREEVDSTAPPLPVSNVWQIAYDGVGHRGFYELRLQRKQGQGEQPVLFAANIDSSESDLRRIDLGQLEKQLDHPKVALLHAGQAAAETVAGRQNEWWRTTLYLLLGVLFTEQALGWLFGRRR